MKSKNVLLLLVGFIICVVGFKVRINLPEVLTVAMKFAGIAIMLIATIMASRASAEQQ